MSSMAPSNIEAKNLSFQYLKFNPPKSVTELYRSKFTDINDTRAPGALPKEKNYLLQKLQTQWL